jgi:transposase-like protein
MRYPASEKLEIIRLVEEGHLSSRQTLAKLGIPRTILNRCYSNKSNADQHIRGANVEPICDALISFRNLGSGLITRI